MKKQAIKPIFLIVLMIAMFASCCYLIRDQDPVPDPTELRYYPEEKVGYYNFDPKTILAYLDRGETGVFLPLEDYGYTNAEYPAIEWSQAQFLQVANALSQQVWNEPLNLDQWDVLSVRFRGGPCRDNANGFFGFEIVYYKTIKTGWEMVYTARSIDLMSGGATAIWAGDGDFSANFFERWQNIELTKFKITAEQAYRIADENGGRAALRYSEDKYCQLYVIAEYGADSWLVGYTGNVFRVIIDPFSGRVRSTK